MVYEIVSRTQCDTFKGHVVAADFKNRCLDLLSKLRKSNVKKVIENVMTGPNFIELLKQKILLKISAEQR